MVICFVGHSHVPSSDEVKRKVKEKIRSVIEGESTVEFYLGGYGAFDGICAKVCRELKNEYDFIKLVYVTPYMTLSEQEKIRDMQKFGEFDLYIYPPLEKIHPRLAIIKRNEWMVANSDLIIAYVNSDLGGAYKSFAFARRKKKR